jgi:hypothetical protein
MPHTAHVAWVAQGTLPGGEVWSCTIRTQPELPPTFELFDIQQGADDALADWKTALTATGGWAQTTTIDRVVGYVYDVNGILVEQAVSSGASQAGGVTIRLPNQCAVCVSLGTGQAGRSRRGRIYLPLLALGVANGKMASTSPGLIADAMDTLFTAAKDWGYDPPSGSGAVVIASATLGIATHVTQIRVGDVIDTQRRRRDGIVEAYATRSLL